MIEDKIVYVNVKVNKGIVYPWCHDSVTWYGYSNITFIHLYKYKIQKIYFILSFEHESKTYPIGGSSVLLRLTASCKVCSSVSDAVLYYS